MISVRVPATSANLGPGFDALGLAISLWLEVQAKRSETDAFLYQGEGALPDSADNLIHKGFAAAYAEVGKQAPKVTFEVDNPIPLARGLGSSSAALVAGIAAADVFLEGALGRDGVFQLAARLEGHPDNVGPAVYGGFTVAARRENETYLCESLQVPETWHLLFGIPDFELPTSRARAVLPNSYSRADLIFNAGRTALWSLAVAQDKPRLLRVASQDRVHEPYREPLVPGLARCRASLLEVGAYAAFLSGAGPTVGVVCSAKTKSACQTVLRTFVGATGKVLSLSAGEGYAVTKDRVKS
ncbi:homoserine kinase [soil metagenome]